MTPGNLVARNVVRGARMGIRLGKHIVPSAGPTTSSAAIWSWEPAAMGFHVAEKDGHSLLIGNTAIGARGDGFDVSSGSATLTRNRAVRNGGLGIEAVAGVIDGGGNRANGNGYPAQCTNVACSK